MKKLIFLIVLIPTFVLAQPPGNGMIFNGTSDYYTVTDNSSIEITGSYTLEAWINPCDTSSHTMILAKQWCSGGQFSFYFSVFNGKLKWTWNTIGSCGGSASSSYESNSVIIRNNIWQHVAVVHTPTSVTLFCNGVPIAGSIVSGSYSGNLYNSTQPLKIGAYRGLSGAYGHFFNGRMDEIRAWNTALTPAQILTRFNGSLTGTEPNLQLYHNFESTIGSVINNSCVATGTTNNGNNVGGALNVMPNTQSYPSGFYLGNDTTFCQPDSMSVSIPTGFSRYAWNDGTTSRNKTISYSGVYIGIGYEDFCFAKDTISVNIVDCDTSIVDTSYPMPVDSCVEAFLMPNVISPNKDGTNDIFIPIYYDCFTLKSFRIYNRWGQLLFESNQKVEWDGKTNKGDDVSDGTYFWIIQHRNKQGIESVEKGFLTIFY